MPAPIETAPPFAFVVFADPHVNREGEHADRLRTAVTWVNEQAPALGIDLVVVVGDIGWTEAGLTLSRTLLDELAVPYVPILGDNEVHIADSEPLFDAVFTPQYDLLASTFDDFERAPPQVEDPTWGPVWHQNLSFRHHGVRFVGLDWVSRDPDPLWGEIAALHDHPGGTWPWFRDRIEALEPGETEDVLLFSHHPMMVLPGAFDLANMDRIRGVTEPVAGRVAAAFAGHLHYDEDRPETDAGFSVHVTDATWDDEVTVRLVQVEHDGARYAYTQELVVIGR